MLDYAKLKTPRQHGAVLVAPPADSLAGLAQENARLLRHADRPLLGSTLAAWREKTRQAIAGDDQRLLIVTGHGPEFIHPGVWAKHVVAGRLASALNGRALNLVVDSDAPRSTALHVPTVSGETVDVTSIPVFHLPPAHAYEQAPVQPAERVQAVERAVRNAMGDRYEHSQMARFFAALADAGACCDWVDQLVAARRAVESQFDVAVEDRRISRVWRSALLLDVILNAERFAASYNRALGEYRRRYHVRGAHRPIPDLQMDDDGCEIPFWAYRHDGLRQRLFVKPAGKGVSLLVAGMEIVSVSSSQLGSSSGIEALSGALSGWRIRPRALALTLEARLLLADLFIHGIGGAKYDRITDVIIADYYGVRPPAMACVSATLHMDLPRDEVTDDTIRRLEHALRDLRYNPQRHLEAAPDIEDLLARRAALVLRSDELRNKRPRDRAARREVFSGIREINTRLLERRDSAIPSRQRALADARDRYRRNAVSQRRDYFFGLYDRGTLQTLLDALPGRSTFRV